MRLARSSYGEIWHQEFSSPLIPGPLPRLETDPTHHRQPRRHSPNRSRRRKSHGTTHTSRTSISPRRLHPPSHSRRHQSLEAAHQRRHRPPDPSNRKTQHPHPLRLPRPPSSNSPRMLRLHRLPPHHRPNLQQSRLWNCTSRNHHLARHVFRTCPKTARIRDENFRTSKVEAQLQRIDCIERKRDNHVVWRESFGRLCSESRGECKGRMGWYWQDCHARELTRENFTSGGSGYHHHVSITGVVEVHLPPQVLFASGKSEIRK